MNRCHEAENSSLVSYDNDDDATKSYSDVLVTLDMKKLVEGSL